MVDAIGVGRPSHRGRRARRPVPDRRVPDRVGDVDEHERQRGDRHAGVASSSVVRCTPTTTSTRRSRRTTPCRRRSAWRCSPCSSTDTHPALEALGAALARPGRPHDRRREGRAHAPHGRHPGDDRTGGRRLGRAGASGRSPARRPTSTSLGELPLGGTAVGTGINVPAGVRRRGGRVARRRDRACRCAPTANPMVHQGGQGALGRGVRRAAGRRRGVDQGRQRHPPARQRTVGRARRAAPARAAGRLVDHAGQGQPGAVRVGQPGGGPGDGQRRHRRVRARRRASSSSTPTCR